MNRRGFLAGVMGLCAGLPLVGRIVPKPAMKILSTGPVTITLPVPVRPGQIVWYSSCFEDPTNWDYSPGTTVKTASTQTDGFTIDWVRG